MTLYKYVRPERTDVLSDGAIRFTPFFEMNDPFEFSFALNARQDELLEAENDDYLFERAEAAQFMRSSFGSLGMLCLSGRRDSKLMWSHYANNHTGYVIGFNPKHKFLNQGTHLTKQYGATDLNGEGFSFPRPIEYLPSPRSISMGQDTFEVLFTKAKCWEYEKEHRVLRNTQSCDIYLREKKLHLFEFPPDSVTEIIIGIGATEKTQNLILEACENRYQTANILYAEIDSRNYKMNFTNQYSKINEIWKTFFSVN